MQRYKKNNSIQPRIDSYSEFEIRFLDGKSETCPRNQASIYKARIANKMLIMFGQNFFLKKSSIMFFFHHEVCFASTRKADDKIASHDHYYYHFHLTRDHDDTMAGNFNPRSQDDSSRYI